MTLIDGKATAAAIKEQIAQEVAQIVALRNEIEWNAAPTETFKYITKQIEFCQGSGQSSILCDIPNIGKTFTARYYVQGHKNAVYIDCSQVKTKLKLVRKIASEFGVDSKGHYFCHPFAPSMEAAS